MDAFATIRTGTDWQADGIAHGFKNMLKAFSGTFNLYKIVADSPETDEGIDAARHASDSTGGIVKQLLIYPPRPRSRNTSPLADLINLTPQDAQRVRGKYRR